MNIAHWAPDWRNKLVILPKLLVVTTEVIECASCVILRIEEHLVRFTSHHAALRLISFASTGQGEHSASAGPMTHSRSTFERKSISSNIVTASR